MTNMQYVQRLESEIIFPRVLENLMTHDTLILQQRENLINSGRYKGNTQELKAYKKNLPRLNQEQLEYCVGLVLGDTTIQANNDVTAWRLKTQQTEKNASLLIAKKRVLLPWVLSGISGIETRPNMLQLQTITDKAFNPLIDIFQDKTKVLKPNACVNKRIPKYIQNYLSPIAISAWYCGDGGRRDYGKNQGKAIQFYTQGFTENCCNILANALKNRYNWNTTVKFDYTNPEGINMFLLQIESNSFESFITTVGPYILSNFQERLPSPRKPNSRFKSDDTLTVDE